MSPSLKNLNKPTPKRLKIIGNALLIIGGSLSASFMTIPDEVMNIHTKFWVTTIVSQLTAAGKLFTSLYTIETSEDTTNGEV